MAEMTTSNPRNKPARSSTGAFRSPATTLMPRLLSSSLLVLLTEEPRDIAMISYSTSAVRNGDSHGEWRAAPSLLCGGQTYEIGRGLEEAVDNGAARCTGCSDDGDLHCGVEVGVVKYEVGPAKLEMQLCVGKAPSVRGKSYGRKSRNSGWIWRLFICSWHRVEGSNDVLAKEHYK